MIAQFLPIDTFVADLSPHFGGGAGIGAWRVFPNKTQPLAIVPIQRVEPSPDAPPPAVRLAVRALNGVGLVVRGSPFAKWFAKLDHLSDLSSDWSSGRTPAPNTETIAQAHKFLTLLQQANREPNTILASVVGGVGITLRNSGRKVYVEFQNKGVTLILFSDGRTRPEATKIGPDDFPRWITQAVVYLDEQHSARHEQERASTHTAIPER